MKRKILELLKSSDGFISGQRISEKCEVSRTSIWKYINSLKEEGYEIQSVSRNGYKLISCPDLLTFEETKKYLDTKYLGNEIIHFESINSTNNYAKDIAMDKAEGTVVTAEQQISGKGRLGRNWTSPSRKGIYFSIILKPNLEPNKVAKLTIIGAAAVHLALMEMNVDSKIKWPNDIVIDGKKVCGILTEMSCELNKINYIVIGIGINANLDEDDFTDDLKDKATSLKMIIGENIERKKLLALVLNHFEKLYDSFKEDLNFLEAVGICRKHSALIGKEIQIIKDGNIKIGKAIDLSDEGELLVQFEDGIENIYSGEVSVRGLNNYI
jgi:BirA family biotin operon repressor/biotin-[acetyl-CoA-carboxylase] ligase